jgi:phage terminase small subunit
MANRKQRAFALEYPKDFNGTRAAKRAGYTGNDATLAAQASRLLRNVKVRKIIQEHLEAMAMETDELLWRLGEKARLDVSQYITTNDNTGNHNIDIEKLKADGKGHLIRNIKNTRDGQQIELADPDAAQQLIGKHLGLFTDRTENLNIDLSNLTNEQLGRIANGESPLDVLANPSKGRA